MGLTSITYPDGRVSTYSYGSAGSMSDYLNRIDTIQDTTSGTTDLASYTYLGAGTVIRITYPEPNVWLDLWGGTSGTFSGLDQFNRIIDQRWQNAITTTPVDIDRYQYGYDQDSNRIWKANVVGTPVVTGGLDEYYTYDHLNRLTQMQRGTLNGGKTGIGGTPAREMDYTLDATGNWSAYLTKTSGTTDLDQTRMSNTVNEITEINESTGPGWITPMYDLAGNMYTMPQVADPTLFFIAGYDAWNRLISIGTADGMIAQYQYDGRGFRVAKLLYDEGAVSQTRHFYYTSGWRDIEQRLDTSTSMDQQHVWGIRYIDELVCRDDATPERLYATQDGIFSVTAITDTSGAVQERFVYDPYGMSAVHDGGWDGTTDAYNWSDRFTGRMQDQESFFLQYRMRLFHPALGVLITRDPIGYADSANFYEFVLCAPTSGLDPYGLTSTDDRTYWIGDQRGNGPSFRVVFVYGPWQCNQDELNDCKQQCQQSNFPFLGCIVVAKYIEQWSNVEVGAYNLGGGPVNRLKQCCCGCPNLSPAQNAQARAKFNAFVNKFRNIIGGLAGDFPKHAGVYPNYPKGAVFPTHHINPISKGGDPTALSNLLPVPGSYHDELHQVDYPECYKAGGKYSTPATPADSANELTQLRGILGK